MVRRLLPLFDVGFLEDHARRLITDPGIALIELIANCWDAGANRVEIRWPDPAPDVFSVEDDGTGMTAKEFIERWRELNYNRRASQGIEVAFPPQNRKSRRRAYGTNGKGRHSMFCFADTYTVETWKDGECNHFTVTRAKGTDATPFLINLVNSYPREGHGTIISTELVRNYLEVVPVRDLIGSKFVSDPDFQIYVNGVLVEMASLKHRTDSRIVPIMGAGEVVVHLVDSYKTGRTSRQHGVAWWVNKRLVGDASWKGFGEDAYLDARTTEAKRYTFVVEADLLADDVLDDWSDFKGTEIVQVVHSTLRQEILGWLRELMKDLHKARKRAAIDAHRKQLRSLPKEAQYHIGRFMDELQGRMTFTLDDRVLSATVEVLSNLEKIRSGRELLEQLASLPPNDLNALHNILESWSVQEA